MKRIVGTIIDLLLVSVVILGTAWMMGLLTGFPKGNDVYGYLTKIRLINTYFPHINWNPFWDSGTPFSIWSYPPLPMTFTTFFFVRLLGFSAEKALTLMAAASFTLLGFGLYGFVKEATGRRLAGLLTLVLFASSPASWNWWGLGNYVRVFGLGFFGLSLWTLAAYLRRLSQGRESRGWFLAILVFTSLAFSSHLLIGGITLAAISFYLLFVGLPFGQKLSLWFKFSVLPLLAAAYFYLPLFLTGKAGGRFVGLNPAYPIPIPNWFHPVNSQADFSLSTVLSVCFLVGLFLAIFFLFFKKNRLSRFEKASAAGFGLFILGNIAYNSLGFLPFYPETFYIVGLPPIGAFALNSLAWAVGAGLFLGIILPKVIKQTKVAAGLLLLLVAIGTFSIFSGKGTLKEVVRDLAQYGTTQDLTQQVVKLEDPNDFNHRFGTDSGLVGDWFTYRFNMPQTRDYFAQGIPHPNWQNWMETAIWYWNNNWNETNFLLDWYAVKYLLVAEPHFNFQKFLGKPESFEVTSTKTFSIPSLTLTQFEKLKPSSVAVATNAPTILIIGASQEYDVFLRALAQTGLDSRKLIPVFANQEIDKFSSSELQKFSAIFLYNYTYRNFEKMEKVLSDYLQSGGRVMIETFKGPEAESLKLPKFFPVRQTKKADVKTNWNFIQKENEFLKKVNLSGFADASYFGYPWHVSQSPKNQLVSGATAILENPSGILMASQKVGEGKVVWSGINFPFHLADKKSPEEMKLLLNILTWFGFGREYPEIKSNYHFINPEKREIQTQSNAKGLLFKETNFTDWQARREMANSKWQKEKIYFAGPGFMFLFLDPNQKNQNLVFTYHLSLIEKIGWLVSILVWIYLFILLLEYLLKRPILSARLGRLLAPKRKNLLANAASWWGKDD